MNKTFLLLISLMLLTKAGCTQNPSQNQSVTLKVKVLNSLPVGWGVRYRGLVIEVVKGNLVDIADTLFFGIVASGTFGYLETGDISVITFENTGEKNKESYLPAINGMVSKKNEIWLITKTEKGK
jgi:hypothetical protein